MSVDPWADKYLGWSTYNYCMANPIIFTDPTGKGVEPKGSKSEINDYTAILNSNSEKLTFSSDENGLKYTYKSYNKDGKDMTYGVDDLNDFEKNMVNNINSPYVSTVNLSGDKNYGFISPNFENLDINELKLLSLDGDLKKLQSSLIEANAIAIGKDIAKQDLSKTTQEDYNWSNKMEIYNSLDPGKQLQMSLSNHFGLDFSENASGAKVWSAPYQSYNPATRQYSASQNAYKYYFGEEGTTGVGTGSYMQIATETKLKTPGSVIDLLNFKNGGWIKKN